MKYIDSHTHLFLEQFNNDYDAVIQRAIEAGVEYMLIPNIDSSSVEDVHALCARYPRNCYPMMGLHPGSVDDQYTFELDRIEKYVQEYSYVAIGETGMDLYWDTTYHRQQREAFIHQIRLAETCGLPVVIHSRSAEQEIVDIMMETEGVNAVLHSFTGTAEQAKMLAQKGYKIGVGGIVTFKNAGIAEMVKELSLDHIVLETDAPYLAPVPKRGKRNESAYIPYIASKMAEIFEVSIDEVAHKTTQNAKAIFDLDQ